MTFDALVRPIITLGLVAAQVGVVAWWTIRGGDTATDAFAALAPFTMMALTFWFKSRDEGKDRAERTGNEPPTG